MVFENSRKLKVSLGIAAVVSLLSLGAYLYFHVDSPTGNFDSAAVTLIFDYGDSRREVFANEEFKQGENLFNFTKNELAAKNIIFEFQKYPSLGKMVTKIGDKKNSAEGGYWQYWINGNYASVGASEYLLKPGDKIEWKFSKSSF
ncbi:hypothetical protein A3I27_02815 [Candidatus Giovannonibacteria bacterium RIFCSPLOWO2_02_FULL_43_11b]|uniref:Transcobalamin-like C-terminal domain-containing protein n=1 Tax=Candidatus Giovannonibacteria bacterium RIFCSPHIGHO2_12_FULL_43_15 TaxID=1798341 RepID=A0A1F5WQX4_9BACT|nr:MAG: hypothetical protein A2739_00050 [Candidatus Giovannonibacteria bacterium RIFCSPHIGHO2_01_FULL_43_100]OGF66107.1 MAG: hypothetical protein A3B97_01220 [Candidatus Giovannonibacteria bacterium RIFCSPHIGHO2_02_FULL_43_32]OGF78073.1 MAG: hypothetical protein A3F23_02625 [Candidatus Giovannonibacteria bacterium RIFCSPHIGHO2_12_FULL_43_15]OGF78816.1 MAG: hypothetical protein A3A15_00315 [Candidatus Giovannonibacteria bacterium RIFCSPLOWO2_01_FULL_43_60]OGF89141.1 MAG: hypothetical protein A3